MSLALVPGLIGALCLAGCAQEPARSPSEQTQDRAVAAQHPVINTGAQSAARLIARDRHLIVLDVRTPTEYAAGHIAGAVNVDFNAPDFAGQLARLDRRARYLVYCRSGRRSAEALGVMDAQGFDRLVHLKDGLKAWKAAGLAVQK